MKEVEVIDENGYWVRTELVEKNKPLGDCFIENRVPSDKTPFYKPKWDFRQSAWVEGLSEEEIAELTKPVLQEPTLEERLQMAEDTIMFMLMGGM